ncbi:MAG TPA: hypothetical protein VHF25_08960 [Nitriliruptorales bacterium]|nr:hypothetical protein [Nitriliruptorales bacterium]
MGLVAMVVGAGLILMAAADAVATTVRVSTRGGVIVRWLGQGLWIVTIAIDRWLPRPILRYLAGPVITLAVMSSWIAMMVTGWFLVFSSSQTSVVTSPGNDPVGAWERLAYAMYTVFTLGGSGLQASTPLWHVLTGMAAGAGLFLVTLAITYLMPLASAASERRRVARALSALGSRPARIVTMAWDGTRFPALADHLMALTPELARLAEHHLTYPVLHYFQTSDREAAIAPAIARLDDALLLLCVAVDPSARPPASVTHPAREAIDGFLSTMPETFLARTQEAPPLPDIEELRAAGVPCRPVEELRSAADEQAERRSRLHGLVLHSGWDWHASMQVTP